MRDVSVAVLMNVGGHNIFPHPCFSQKQDRSICFGGHLGPFYHFAHHSALEKYRVFGVDFFAADLSHPGTAIFTGLVVDTQVAGQ